MLSETGQTKQAGGQLSISSLRVLRVLRPLRTISSIKGLKILMQALFTAIPLLIDTLTVMLFYFIIGGIAGNQIFSGLLKNRCVDLQSGVVNADYIFGNSNGACGGYSQCPTNQVCAKSNINPYFGAINFDNILWGIFNFYYAITYEGWSLTQLQLQQTMTQWIWLAFTPYTYLGAYFLLNLFLAVISSKFSEAAQQQQDNERKKKTIIDLKQENEKEVIIFNKKKKQQLTLSQFINARIQAKKMLNFVKRRKEQRQKQEELNKIKMEKQNLIIDQQRTIDKKQQNQIFSLNFDIKSKLFGSKKQSEISVQDNQKNISIQDQDISELTIKLDQEQMDIIDYMEDEQQKEVASYFDDKQNLEPINKQYFETNTKFFPSNFEKKDRFASSLGKRVNNGILMKGNIGFIHKKLFNNLVSAKQQTILQKLGEELEIEKVINSNQNLLNSDQSQRNYKQLSQSSYNYSVNLQKQINKMNYQSSSQKSIQKDSSQLITSESDIEAVVYAAAFKKNAHLQNQNKDKKINLKKDVSKTFKRILNQNHNLESKHNFLKKMNKVHIYQNSVTTQQQTEIEKKYAKKNKRTFDQLRNHKNYQEDCLNQNMGYELQEFTNNNHKMNNFYNIIKNEQADYFYFEEFISKKKPINPFKNMNNNFQKVTINSDQQFQSTSINDLFECRESIINNSQEENKYLISQKKYSEFEDQEFIKTCHEPFQQKIDYQIQENSDEMEDSSSPNEDQICLSEQPYETSSRIQFKEYLQHLNLHEIFKRSDITISSTLSLNLFPKDKRKNKNVDVFQMNEDQLIQYILNKNEYKALEKCFMNVHKHTRYKDNVYRENYIKSFIYRSRFKSDSLKKFKSMVSLLNLSKIIQKPKEQCIIKEEIKRFEQNKKSIEKKNFPKFSIEQGKQLIEGKFHEENDDVQSSSDDETDPEKAKLDFFKESLKQILKENTSNSEHKIDSIPIDLRKEFDIPQEIEDKVIDYSQIRKLDSSKKKKTPIWSGQDVLIDSIDMGKSQYIVNKLSSIRVWPEGLIGYLKRIRVLLRVIVRHPLFDNFFTFVVLCNTTTLALDAYGNSAELENNLQLFNSYFTYIFITEISCKILALGTKKYSSDVMNLLDGSVVLMSIFEIIYSQIVQSGGSSNLKTFKTLRLIRTFRVFRVARLLRALKSMQTILRVMIKSYSSFIYITMLMFLFILIFSLLGMQFFGGKFLDYPLGYPKQNWDTIGFAIITCFNIMQQENWNNIIFQMAWAAKDLVSLYVGMTYLCIWLFIGNYIMLNLFLSILLDAFFEAPEDEDDLEFIEEQKQAKKLRRIENKKRKDKHKVFMSEEALASKKLKKLQDIDQIEDLEDLEEEQIINILQQEGIMIKEKSEVLDEALFEGIECNQSLYVFTKQNFVRLNFCRLYRNKLWENIVLGVILFSSFKLATDTYNDRFNQQGAYIQTMKSLDQIFNYLFTFEMIVKIISLGFIMDNGSYLRESWNILDFGIVSSSLLEMSLQSINIPFIRILRLLRVLRPLRFISHNKDLKLIVIALLESISSILNVAVIISVVFLIFSIVGVSLQGGNYFYCTMNPYINIKQNQCLLAGGDWYVYQSNFDNVLQGFLTLFIISNGEGWPNNLQVWMDSYDTDTGPVVNASVTEAIIFFILFLMIGQFFFINFFVGVLFMKFEEARSQEEKGYSNTDLNWIDIQKLIVQSDPDYESTNVPKQNWRRWFHELVTSSKFDLFIVAVIILNILSMAIEHENMNGFWILLINDFATIFTVVFIIEMILKLIAFGRSYFNYGWNKFDFFVVCAAIFDIILNNMNSQSLSVISFAPALAKVLRVLRVTRVIKLASKAKGLQSLIETIQFAIRPLGNVLMLDMIVFYMFSILGNAIFKGVTQGDILDPNFKNWNDWHHSFLLVLVFSTGEDWPKTMYQCSLYPSDGCIMGQTCGSHFSYLYFMMLIIALDYIFISLFQIVIIGQFEKYYLPKDNMINQFKLDTEQFMRVWIEFTQQKYNCFKIKENMLEKFFRRLGDFGDRNSSLGFSEDYYTDSELKKIILKMGIKADSYGFIYFNEMLYRCMKLKYGNMKINKNMQIIELRTQYFIFLKTLETQQTSSSLTNDQIFNNIISKKNGINPFLTIMNFKISFRTWLKHARNIMRLKKKLLRTYDDALKMISISLKAEMKKLKFEKVMIELEEFAEYTSEEDEKTKNDKIQSKKLTKKQSRQSSILLGPSFDTFSKATANLSQNNIDKYKKKMTQSIKQGLQRDSSLSPSKVKQKQFFNYKKIKKNKSSNKEKELSISMQSEKTLD